MNTSSKWILLSFAMGTGVGAGGSGACAPAAWKEEGSRYMRRGAGGGGHLTLDSVLRVLSELPGTGRELWRFCLFLMILLMFNRRRHLPLSGKLLSLSYAWKGLGSSSVAIV